MRCVSAKCYDQTYGPPAEEVRQESALVARNDSCCLSFAFTVSAINLVSLNDISHVTDTSCLDSWVLSGGCGQQLEEGEIDKPRENQYNRCVKAEARTWK